MKTDEIASALDTLFAIGIVADWSSSMEDGKMIISVEFVGRRMEIAFNENNEMTDWTEQ